MQLKAFARQDGMMLAVLWIASFACMTVIPAGAFGNLLALATPFFVVWRLIQFRDKVLDGTASFRRSFAFAFYVFVYASLVFALAQFAYFRFLDGGTFASAIGESLRLLAPVYEQNGISKAQIDDYMRLVSMLTPVQWAFIFLMQNLAIGAVVSVPIAAVCKRSGWTTTAR